MLRLPSCPVSARGAGAGSGPWAAAPGRCRGSWQISECRGRGRRGRAASSSKDGEASAGDILRRRKPARLDLSSGRTALGDPRPRPPLRLLTPTPPPPRPPGTARKGPPGPTRPGPAGPGTGGGRGPSPVGLGSAFRSPTRCPGAWAPVPAVSRARGLRPGFSARRWASSDVSGDVCLGGNKTPSRRPPSPD